MRESRRKARKEPHAIEKLIEKVMTSPCSSCDHQSVGMEKNAPTPPQLQGGGGAEGGRLDDCILLRCAEPQAQALAHYCWTRYGRYRQTSHRGSPSGTSTYRIHTSATVPSLSFPSTCSNAVTTALPLLTRAGVPGSPPFSHAPLPRGLAGLLPLSLPPAVSLFPDGI